MNKLLLGDNLEILRQLNSESVDLIYLDPPFFSNRNYEVIWGDAGEVRSFQDRFSGGIDHYISWLKDRVQELHRILKPTGSIFLHCDWHADAYIRVHILDKIFGVNNFRGDIVWRRTNAHNDAKKKLGVLSDTIWYYSKSNDFCYKGIYINLSDDYKSSMYRYEDKKGVYRRDNLTGPGLNPNDVEWRGYHPAKIGRSWSVSRDAVKNLVGEDVAKTMSTSQKLDLLYDNGLIDISKNNVPSFKRYLETSKGQLLGNIWIDIPNVQAQSKERIGYPTQKPEALLQRIIEMASNEGDIVLDPFVGGGTTVAVADRLKRGWIGIDQSVQAVKVTELRLQNQQDLFSAPFSVHLHKYDYDTLRYKDAFEFEEFIVQQFGGYSNTKQRGDLGIDGRTREGCPIQVKRSDNIGRNVIDNFFSAIQRFDKSAYERNKAENKPVGFIIAFSFGKGARQETARLKNEEGVEIQLVEVESIIPIAKKPTLKLSVRDLGKDKKGVQEVEFTAEASSEAGIEFFCWDFSFDEQTRQFKADVLLDKEGKQTQKFKAGTHCIGVKVVDNDGLESVESVRLKVNGTLTL